MHPLNFHHLRYFHAIVEAGGLSRAAAALNVSPSALSVQLQQLEAQLGQNLFDRAGRKLVLTEAGQIALGQAEIIFAAGDELVQSLKGVSGKRVSHVRVGAVSTLSRNFQRGFLAPLNGAANLRLSLRTGSLKELLAALEVHQLDVVLTNSLPTRDDRARWTVHRLAKQPIALVGPKRPGRKPKLESLLAREKLIAPTPQNHIRAELDAFLELKGIKAHIVAEVDDMAMMRVLAREGWGYAVAPPVVVRDELKSGELAEYGRIGALNEVFYAIVPTRRFPNLMVELMLKSKG